MKLNSIQIGGATLLALLVGFSPMLSAQPRSQMGNPSTSEQPQSNPSTTSDASRMQQQSQQQMQQAQQQVQQGVQQAQQQFAGLQRKSAHELTGMNVKNRSGEPLGEVKDFVVDAQSGQVIYTIIGSGGVLGIGERLHAVPVSALRYDSSSGADLLTLDIPSDRWSQAPRFKKDLLSSLQGDQEGRSTFEYYGQTWPAPAQGQASTSQQPTQQQKQAQFVLTSDIIGKDIRSGGQNIGEVDDVLLQLQNRTAALLIDPSNEFAGTNQKYIVPFSKLTVSGVAGDSLATSLSREDFSSAQVAQGDVWASSPSGYVSSLYVYSRGETAGVAQSQDSGMVQSETDRGVSHTQAGQQPPVAEIRRALQSDSSLASQGGADISVVAQGDKVLLLGTVQSKEAKDKIEERAEQAAPGWDIQNQIRVATADE